jgi:hypothetical protein
LNFVTAADTTGASASGSLCGAGAVPGIGDDEGNGNESAIRFSF